jgi:hypothetical protein
MSFWIWNRALTHKDDIEVMIHEPYLPMRQSRLKHSALALAHRVMLMAVLRRASRVWTSIPKWEEYCRPYTLGRSIPFAWLPVVSNIPVAGEEQCRASAAIRARYAPAQGNLIGHFGTCGGAIGDALSEIVPSLLNHCPERTLLLIGRDSGEARERLVRDCPQLRNRIYPTGSLSSAEVSAHISACDVMVQPYPDGVSSRRGSLMAPLSHGRPIVATSGRLTEPLWHDAAAAVLVPAGAHQQMAAAVEDLLVDKNKRDRLSAAAKTMYEQHFALNRVIGRLRNEVSA